MPAAPEKLMAIVIPAYNEEDTVVEAIERIQKVIPVLNERNYEVRILIVDDGCSDKTVERASTCEGVEIIRHPVNLGLGAAVRTGLKAARDIGADVAIKIDADLQHDPFDIVEMIGPIDGGKADIVYGNRFERIDYQMPFVRRTGNIVFTSLMRWLTRWPLRDSQPGIFAAGKSYLSVFQIPGDYNYTQQILLDAYHKHMRFAHVPVSFSKRISGQSFVSLKYPLKVLPQILMVLVGVKPMKVFFPIALGCLAIATGISFVEMVSWLFGAAPKPVQSVNLVMGLGLLGIQTLFFGVIAELIVQQKR